MEIFSTLMLADAAVLTAVFSLAGSLLLALVGLGREARRRK